MNLSGDRSWQKDHRYNKGQDIVSSEVKVVKSFGCAVTYAEAYANDMGVDEIVAFGGARIYESAIPIAKKIYKTEVDLHPDGDTFFPEYKRDEWREVARQILCTK